MAQKTADQRKKILYFITQAELGGAQRYVFDLANNLKGDFATAVALGEQGNNGKLAKILTENNIKCFVLPHLKRSISPVNEILAFREIIRVIKSYQPDIIHLNSSKISILGSLSGIFTKAKIIYTAHGWVFNEPLPAWLKYFYLYAEKITARFKYKIICVSEFDRLTALEHKIAPAEKLITIHNGLAPINFCDRQTALSALNGRGIATDKILIGSLGNLYKTKSFEYFIQAAEILINRFRLPAIFLIIGEGDERKRMESLIAKYNLKNNFILAGQIDQAARLLPVLDIYVCSSVKEGFPYSLLEAMRAGRPIISTNVGGIPEMIKNGKNGLLVKPADAEALAAKIKTMIDDKKLAAELGNNAKILAEKKFDLKKMIEKTKNVYR